MALATTLVVISLATALNDIIEKAREIRDSFEKLPQNYRNTLSLAKDIARCAEKMRSVYGERKDIFDRTPDLQESLHELYQEMVLVHSRCKSLIPPTTEKKRNRFKLAFYSFLNREKVARLVLELKDHVNGCYKQFVLLSSIRIEATVNQIAHVVNTVAENQSCLTNGYSGTPSPSSARFYSNHSSSFSMTPVQNAIHQHKLSEAYLHKELGVVEKLLGRLVSRWARNPPNSFPVPLATSTWGLQLSAVKDNALHQSMVIGAFQLQSIFLETDVAIISTLGSAIGSLSSLLGEGGLHDGSLVIRGLAVTFYKKLLSMHPSRNIQIALTCHLTNLSICYINIGNIKQAYETSQEAVHRIHQLLGIGNEQSIILRECLARNLTLQASINHPLISTNSIELASLAVGTLEHILGIQDKHANFEPSRVAISQYTDDRLFTYSHALLSLSTLQENQGYITDALLTKKKALHVLNTLATLYPHSRRILQAKAGLLFNIRGYKYRSQNSIEESLVYGEECATIYSQLLQKSGSASHLRSLSIVWLLQKQLLISMGRLDDAETVYKQITCLAEAAVERYLDLELPSEIEGDYYYHLSIVHRTARHFLDAINAVQNAIAQYSSLELLDSNFSSYKHVQALNMLCKLFCESHQHRAALVEGNKAIQIADNSSERMTPQFKEMYLELFESIMEALESISGTTSLQRATYISARFQILLSRPIGKALTTSTLPATYMAILGKNGMFDEAIDYTDNFLSTWEVTSNHFTNSDCVYPYLKCMKARSSLLRARGLRDEALKSNSLAIDFSRAHSHSNNSALVRRMQRTVALDHISLLFDAFHYEGALQFSQELIQSYRNKAVEGAESMIEALHYLGLAQVHNCMPLQAIDTTTEGLSLCQSEISNGQMYPRIWVYLFRVGQADALFDAGRLDEAQIRLDEASDVLLASPYSADETAKYVFSSRSSQLSFAHGEYSKSINLIPENIKYQQKALITDIFSLGKLAQVLRFSSLAFCCGGQHEKGEATLAKLAKLMKENAISNPDCSREAQILLEKEANRGKWKIIFKKGRASLRCDHQDDTLNVAG